MSDLGWDEEPKDRSQTNRERVSRAAVWTGSLGGVTCVLASIWAPWVTYWTGGDQPRWTSSGLQGGQHGLVTLALGVAVVLGALLAYNARNRWRILLVALPALGELLLALRFSMAPSPFLVGGYGSVRHPHVALGLHLLVVASAVTVGVSLRLLQRDMPERQSTRVGHS